MNREFSIYLYNQFSQALLYAKQGENLDSTTKTHISSKRLGEHTQTTSNNDVQNYKKRARFGEKNKHTSQTFFCGTCDENRFKADVYQHVYQLACLTQKIYQQHINMQRYFLLSQTKFYFLQKTTFYLLLRTTTGNMQKQATSYQILQNHFQSHFFQLQTLTWRVGQTKVQLSLLSHGGSQQSTAPPVGIILGCVALCLAEAYPGHPKQCLFPCLSPRSLKVRVSKWGAKSSNIFSKKKK